MTNFFDKYELYTEGESIYCYNGTSVLKNKFGIKDPEEFSEAEAEIAFAGLLELKLHPIKGNFDRKHLYAIHIFLFATFYPFAGQTRMEDISKGKTKFCVYNYIDEQLDALFTKIKNRDKSEKMTKEALGEFLAFIMSELNIIHPFREGNGRTIREFIREYALTFGYDIDWSKKEKTELMDAMIESVFDNKRLQECLYSCMVKQNQ